ncbi:hypothetical protein [Haliscomenobacter sp.]|uniref:hypothetical protein n=1 Tax=Haliscomenobacter sp. TaxID=2717303 RepID=UPI003593F14C
MPILTKEENRETHPYLELGRIPGAKSMVLGSFPVYACTDPDTADKQKMRAENTKKKPIRFFYGSASSSFWPRYQQYVDPELIAPFNETELRESIAKKKIAFSDTIQSCVRKGESSLDSSLSEKEWNIQGVQSLLQSGTSKVLCTSKGVLRDLEHKIIKHDPTHPFGQVDETRSIQFQAAFLKKLGIANPVLTSPVARVFLVDGQLIEALAIPSPGSPHRQLRHFGYVEGERKVFSDGYFDAAFGWLVGNE